MQIESWGPFAEGKHGIFQNELLRSIADRYQKTVAQVILRWLTQRDIVAIPKSVRPDRMAENFDIFDFRAEPGRHGGDRHARHPNEQLLRPSRSRHGETAQRSDANYLSSFPFIGTSQQGEITVEQRTLGAALKVSAIGLGCMGMSMRLRTEPWQPGRDDRRPPFRGRSGRHLLRHRRGLWTVCQRGTGRRGAGPCPRTGGHCHQVRLAHPGRAGWSA